MKCILNLAMVICSLVAAFGIFLWSGRYNVGADAQHWKSTEWFLSMLRDRSISAHSKDIVIPPLNGHKLSALGFQHYDAMCRLCHNAPGYSRSDVAKGLYPSPPDFFSKKFEMPGNAETYWIVKHGIKMTGMPSFGTTHSEEEILALISVIRQVGQMTPGEYAAMLKAAGVTGQHEHHH